MKPSRKTEPLVFSQGFSWSQPLDLQASLRIRDGLTEEPRSLIPRHVLQTLHARAVYDRRVSLN